MGAIYEQTTRSKSGTEALMGILFTLQVLSNAAYMSAANRLVLGFARTRACKSSIHSHRLEVVLHPNLTLRNVCAVPCSTWLSAYDHELEIAPNIVYLMFAINVVLGFVELGSSSSINTLVGAATLLFCVGYIPIFFGYLLRGGRYLGNMGWFRLPRPVSLFLAAFNVASLVLQAVMFCLTPTYPITAENTNWASVIAGSLLIMLFMSFWLYGKAHYQTEEHLLVIHGEEGALNVNKNRETSARNLDWEK